MTKKRYFSVYSDFKTALLSKLCFMLSGIFILFVLFVQAMAMFFQGTTEGIIGTIVSLKHSSYMDISLAMIILFLGAGVITLFFHHQFKKLAEIADELEKMEETE